MCAGNLKIRFLSYTFGTLTSPFLTLQNNKSWVVSPGGGVQVRCGYRISERGEGVRVTVKY